MVVNSKKYIEICACRTWNNSSILVNKGEQFSFHVKKILEPWEDGNISADPHDGGSDNRWLGIIISSLKRDSDSKWYKLVGSIGKGKKMRTFLPLDYYGEIESNVLDEKVRNGDLFIDNQTQEIKKEVDCSVLYFFANDDECRYINNKRMLILEVTCLK